MTADLFRLHDTRGPKPKYAVYVLSDPRDPPYPVYVGYGTAGYRVLWEYREHLEDKLGDWFRDLAANSLRPSVKGLGICVRRSQAKSLAEWKLWEICYDASRVDPPVWWDEQLVNRQPSPRINVPVKRVYNGVTTRYGSCREAARQTGYRHRDVCRYVTEGVLDAQGGFWCVSAAPHRALLPIEIHEPAA